MVERRVLTTIIKKSKVLFVTLIIICACAIGFESSFISSYFNFKNESSRYFKEFGLPDIILNLNNYTSDEYISDLKYEGTTVESRFQEVFPVEINEEAYSTRLTTLNKDSFAKLYTLNEKTNNTEYPSIYLDFVFANNNKIEAGQTLDLKLGSNQKQTFFISKIVGSPESISIDTYQNVPTNRFEFSYTYVERDAFNLTKNLSNQVIVKFNNLNLDKDNVFESLKTQLGDLNIKVKSKTFKEKNSSYERIDSILEDLQKVTFAVPLVFMIILLIILFLFLYQICKNITHEFGIMMAVGVSVKQILLGLLLFAVVITVSSCAFGFGIGAGLSGVIFNVIKFNYAMPLGQGILNFGVSILSFVALLFVTSGSVVFSTIFLRKVTPLEALNEQKGSYKPLPNMIENITNKGPISNKLAIASLSKNLSRTIISIIAIIGTYLLCFSCFNLYQGEQHLIDQLSSRCNYDAEVYLGNNNDYSTINNYLITEKNNLNISELEQTKTASFKFEKQDLTYTVVGINPTSDMFRIEDNRANKITLEEGSNIIIDINHAEKLGVKKGEKVLINGNEISINNISCLSSRKREYVSLKTFEKIVGTTSYYTTICVRCNDVKKLKNVLEDKFSCVVLDVKTFVKDSTVGAQAISLLSSIMVYVTTGLGFLILLIMSMISFNEQKRKFALMRTIGLKISDVSKILTWSNVFYILIGLIFGIPGGVGLTIGLLKFCSTQSISIIFLNYPWVYFLMIGGIVLILAICEIVSLIKVKRLNLMEMLRARD